MSQQQQQHPQQHYTLHPPPEYGSAPAGALTQQSTATSQKRKLMTLDLGVGSNPTGKSVIKKSRLSSLQTPIYSSNTELLSSPDFKNIQTPDLDFAIRGLFGSSSSTLGTPINSEYSAQAPQVQVSAGAPAQVQVSAPAPGQVHSNSHNSQQSITQQQQQLLLLETNNSTADNSSAQYDSSDSESLSDMSMSSSSQYSGKVKQEPGLSNTTPIDMASQEKIKLERKRMRNRVAASKCRKRKLEKISKLEDKVNCLKRENGELNGVLDKLRDSVSELKEQVMRHANAGCQIVLLQGY